MDTINTVKEILVTYQPHYRGNAISCIISIPSVCSSAQERLDFIQKLTIGIL